MAVTASPVAMDVMANLALMGNPASEAQAAVPAAMVGLVIAVHQARQDRKAPLGDQSLDRVAHPVSQVVPARMVATASLVVMAIPAGPASEAQLATPAATAGLVIAVRPVPLVPRVTEERLVPPAPLEREEQEVLPELTALTAGTAHPALLVFQVLQGPRADKVYKGQREHPESRATKEPRVTREPRAQRAVPVPGACPAPAALMAGLVLPAAPAETDATGGTAKTVSRTPSASPCRASLSCLSTVSASVPAATLATPTRFSPRSRLAATL